ncbi:MAG: DUF3107 domain-containing protein [Acidimicrobiia bacterium]|nr:DUF3107 domain-containing protein [Acidimicrobiia bacterium]MXY73433.1 DUF3107 domain-containing protein [Acidimicrobiia bacterium]MYA39767.1 DUF3107 domain-containing protein [Acidimicrobiia bacterium]MYB79208.1 DUF3107 domain-containing protein [Acidimicrobiia bacterium]MYH05858.1 DUF3107 domain-containing protein [Acidimicrobiia bacterium]
MKIKVGIAHTNRVIEIDSQDAEGIRSRIEEAFAGSQPMVWLQDSDGTRIGIPRDKLAFVEFESDEEPSGVGFAAGS